MQSAKCPHCGKDIEVATAKDLDEEFSISPNALQHAREKEQFPSPWLEFANRNVWLTADVEAYASARTQERVEKRVEELGKLLGNLSAAEKKAVITALSN